jgi:cell division protein FtsB
MKRILFLFFIIISISIIYNYALSIYGLWHKKDVLVQAQKQLDQVQKENTDLQKQLSTAKNPEFVEEQAHDKLFLVKPGENTVVIPQKLLPTPIPAKYLIPPKSNWQKWIELFWHGQ